jgi:hypothetical protein
VITDVLLAMHANRLGRALPSARYRHVHVTQRPFVIVGYHLPGDPSAPIGLMYGDHPLRPGLAYTLEPHLWRNKIDAMQDFARSLNLYIANATRGSRDAPQLLLSNQAAVDWLCGDIGRYWRRLEEDGEWGAGPSIPVAGAHLSYFAGANHIPGSSAVLALANVLSAHWATGRLAALDRRLGVELAWIQDPDNIPAAELDLSDGPVPDATWENDEYLVALNAYQRHQGSDNKPARIVEQVVRAALAPLYDQAWRAHELLLTMTEAETVSERWNRDRVRYSSHADRIRAERAYFRDRLPLLDAYVHIDRVERMTAELQHAMAFDDEIIMARYIADGSALCGQVIARTDTRLTLRPDIAFDRGTGTRLWWRTRDTVNNRSRHVFIELRVNRVTADDVELEIVRGANNPDTRRRLPAVGATITCAPFGEPEFRRSSMPTALPWTHTPDGTP